jgi:hypothetical protein
LTDVVLFAAIADVDVSVALAIDSRGLRLLSVVVALGTVRAVLLLTGGKALELAAPMAFIALVLCLAVFGWRSGRGDWSLNGNGLPRSRQGAASPGVTRPLS